VDIVQTGTGFGVVEADCGALLVVCDGVGTGDSDEILVIQLTEQHPNALEARKQLTTKMSRTTMKLLSY